MTFEFMRVLGGLCKGRGQRQIVDQELFLVLLSFRKLQDFGELSARNWGRDQYVFSIISQTCMFMKGKVDDLTVVRSSKGVFYAATKQINYNNIVCKKMNELYW